jgi:hypothetical protein
VQCIEGGDVRVVQPSEAFRLAHEPAEARDVAVQLWSQHLYRDGPLQQFVDAAKNLAEAAAAQAVLDAVMP